MESSIGTLGRQCRALTWATGCSSVRHLAASRPHSGLMVPARSSLMAARDARASAVAAAVAFARLAAYAATTADACGVGSNPRAFCVHTTQSNGCRSVSTVSTRYQLHVV